MTGAAITSYKSLSLAALHCRAGTLPPAPLVALQRHLARSGKALALFCEVC